MWVKGGVTVENYVDNSVKSGLISSAAGRDVGNWGDIKNFFERFPRFFAGKRYKLINFAPEKRNVDK